MLKQITNLDHTHHQRNNQVKSMMAFEYNNENKSQTNSQKSLPDANGKNHTTAKVSLQLSNDHKKFKAKNPEIFQKAQKAKNPIDWYSRLQDSKSALLSSVIPKSLSPSHESLSESAFDLMLSAKKEMKKHTQNHNTVSNLNQHKRFKLSKDQ